MPKLIWDKVGERYYETGTSKGALFLADTTGEYLPGVAWNGLVAVRQSPDGAEETPIFADNIKYLALTSAENFKGTIEAYTYPTDFAKADGSAEVIPGVYLGQQARTTFGMAYSTIVGNDTMGNDFGEKIHIIYGAKVSPTERSYETVNNDPNAITFSWAFSTTSASVSAEGFKPTAYFTIDSTKVSAVVFKSVQDLIYGTELVVSALPSIDELITLVKAAPVVPAG